MFELERRRRIEHAQLNGAHHALADSAKRHAGFLNLTMDVDDLSGRAGHSMPRLQHLLYAPVVNVRNAKSIFQALTQTILY
jgi:NAD-dependent SIR2 family protein deacetylase